VDGAGQIGRPVNDCFSHKACQASPCRLRGYDSLLIGCLYAKRLVTHFDHEPGRDAFHRVPSLAEEFRDAVECVPTSRGGRLMESSLGLAVLLADLEPVERTSGFGVHLIGCSESDVTRLGQTIQALGASGGVECAR
jgi:hypothetical protein